MPDQEVEAIGEFVSPFIAGERELDPESFSYFRLIMRVRERRRDRSRFLSRLLLTPGVGEWESVQLPDSLFPLYRAVRLLRVARRLAF